MYSKIAIGNVKKSFKDYTIYFLTLTLAVSIFYSFNSIGSQKALLEMSASGKAYVNILTSIISGVSVFVSFILGSLILYANNFLIKKRNKELGIYMTLGMGKGKISKILVLETMIVGVISLISGLILGLGLSQGLSILVSKLFEVKMNQYTFIISIAAIGKTIFYFGIMFLLVMIFNTYVISKYRIIDLLTEARKTEEIKFKIPIIYLITFILCVASLGAAYTMILEVGLNVEDPKFLLSIILGIVGTVLFFFSLTGFILFIIKKNKKIYFKGLNIFIVKQLNSKVNTNFISMSIISLMLFITIGVLSTGLSFKNAIESGLEGATPFDASATMYIDSDDKVQSVEESLKKMGYNLDENKKYAVLDVYLADTKIGDIMNIDDNSKGSDFSVEYVKISQYNELRKLKNEEPINLNKNEVLITSNFSKTAPLIKEYMDKNNTIKIKDNIYNIKNKEIIKENMTTYFMQNNILTIVINDEFCDNASLSISNLNLNFSKENKEEEKKFIEVINAYRNSELNREEVGFVLGETRNEVYESSKGMTTSILFVGIYLGIVFLISSMAVLALQQLSEASDSIDRYTSLKKLGANQKSINKTIFTQTLVYFSLPAILALVHSVVGIKVANDFISLYNQPDISGSSIITAGIFLLVYITYFYATYTGYKNIVKSKI